MKLLNIFRSRASIQKTERHKKLNEEIAKIKSAKDELYKWDDISMSWQYRNICQILELPYCDGPILYIDRLLFSNDYEEQAKELTNLRNILIGNWND